MNCFISLLALVVIGTQELFAMRQEQKMIPTNIPTVAKVAGTDTLDKTKAITEYKKEVLQAQAENAKIPVKNESVCRIATYNVHFWRNPENTQDTMDEIIQVIKAINPDVLVLQEVSPVPGHKKGGDDFEGSRAQTQLKNIGFNYFIICNSFTADGEPQPGAGWYGNVIASKISFDEQLAHTFETQIFFRKEKRCAVYEKMTLSNGMSVYGYGAQVESQGKEEFRKKQLSEIVIYILDELKYQNVFIAATLNATRNEMPFKYTQESNLKDCFTYINWQHPQFTNWMGREVDYIFLSANWKLPITGCYVYYSAASNHLPIIMDISLKAEQPGEKAKDPFSQALIDLSNSLKKFGDEIKK